MSIRISVLAVPMLVALFLPRGVWSQVGSPAGPVPPEALTLRRDRLVEALGGAPALISSARQRDMEAEYFQDADYREDNDFFYLTGLEAPSAWLAVNLGGSGSVTLYLPPRSPGAEQWTGPRLGPGPEASRITGIQDIRSVEELPVDMDRWSSPPEAGAADTRKSVLVSLGDGQPPELLDTLLDTLVVPARWDRRGLQEILARLRVVKDQEELRRLRRAGEITAAGQREVWRVGEAGLLELQLEAVLEYVFKIHGAERVGFPSIVGSGPYSVILHYDRNRRRLEEGDLVVMDVGAEFGYYTADITRTFPVSGTFSPRQRAIYDLVLGAWAAALEEVRPGGSITDMNRAARAYFSQRSGDLCGPDTCAPFLIHGVSHWLGMDVHDVGDSRMSFEPGMVVTLEPGLYLPDEALGVRIEDDILVTEDGHEVLTAGLPRSSEEIEAVMREQPRWVRELPRDPGSVPGVPMGGDKTPETQKGRDRHE